MGAGWAMVPLGEVLRLALDPHSVDASRSYPNLGIYGFGRGVFQKAPIEGTNTSASTLYRVRAGQFIYSRLFAFEGAYALVPPELCGSYVSNEFPTFDCDPRRLDVGFLTWLFKRPTLWRGIAERSTGMGDRRQRIHPEQVLAEEIPLPPLDEQRRIVARIDALAAKIAEARGLRETARKVLDRFEAAASVNGFPTPSSKKVGDYVRFQTGYAFKSEWFVPEGIRVARNANVSHGVLDWSETARVPAAYQTEYARFDLKHGDLLVSLDRPLISTGVKVARVREQDLPCLLLQRVARAVFVSDELDPAYLFVWLRSAAFASAIDPGRSNGVPHISHKDIEAIPFAAPSRNEQRRIVAELDALQAKVDAVKRLQAETAAELDALLPAILDRAFKGEL